MLSKANHRMQYRVCFAFREERTAALARRFAIQVVEPCSGMGVILIKYYLDIGPGGNAKSNVCRTYSALSRFPSVRALTGFYASWLD
jgi:hypothetical protein